MRNNTRSIRYNNKIKVAIYDENSNELQDAILRRDYKLVRNITENLSTNVLNKKIVELAIKSGDTRIATLILDKTDTSEFDKEILELSINSKKQGIIDLLIDKTHVKYFDDETLIMGIKTNNIQIAQDINNKTPGKYFTKKILKVALQTGKIDIVKSIASKTKDEVFDKEVLFEAIKTKNRNIVQGISNRTDKKNFLKNHIALAIESSDNGILEIILDKSNKENIDKDILKFALKNKNINMIDTVFNRAQKENLDKDILKSVINSRNINIVRPILKIINNNLFDKEIIYEAINTKNINVFREVTKKTKPKFFDKEVFDKVMDENSPELARALVDYTSDRKIFEECKNQIQQSILKENEILNLTGQLLNFESNESEDREMQELVLDIYLDTIKKHYNKGELPKNFHMKEFEDSMKESRYFFSCPNKINFDSLNDKNRFLILPIITVGHAFSAVVKKLDNEKISVTFVNLGNRFYECTSGESEYKEFVYSKENALKVLKAHSYNVRLYYPQMAVDSPEAYKRFSKLALDIYPLNVISREQKVGNCFIKNIEKGIRYALTIQLTKDTSKNFEPALLRESNNNQKKLKVKFLKPLLKSSYKIKDMSTLDLKRELIENLIKRFPQYKEKISKRWKYYKEHKERNSPNVLIGQHSNILQRKHKHTMTR